MAEVTWAKIAANLHRNPKIRKAGRDARDVFTLMLLVNSDLKADGEFSDLYADPDYMADTLQCTVEEAERGLKRCETFHLLQVTPATEDESGVVRILGWDDEWRIATSTDRVRKHRAKKKKQQVKTDETLRNVPDVSCNGETPRGDRGTRGEEIEELEPPYPQGLAEECGGPDILQLAHDVLMTLNEQAGQQFPIASTEMVKDIAKRLRGREGEPAATVADLELVIAHRVAVWGGTEREEFLRPKTLFAKQHFTGYLAAARVWEMQGRPARKPERQGGHYEHTGREDYAGGEVEL